MHMKTTRYDKIPGLYIHVPFCKSKCPYCDFYSVTSLSLIPAWIEGIKKEVLIYKDLFASFDSLYLGGGTPTVTNEPDLMHLVDYLFTHFSFSPDSEISIEANPDDITQEKLKLLRNLGINRYYCNILKNFLLTHHLTLPLSYQAESICGFPQFLFSFFLPMPSLNLIHI